MKKFIMITSIFIVLFLIANIISSFVIYDFAIARTKKASFIEDNSSDQPLPASTEIKNNKTSENITNWYSIHTYEEITIVSDDNIKLKGYYLAAKVPTTKTVILAHGYSSRGTYMGLYAKLYHEKFGYNVLLPDARAHGNSEGDYIGFGWIDRKDYLKWIDFIINRVGKDSQIVLHGVSMGGATVLMCSGENLPQNVKAIVSDCAYTSVMDELRYQLKKRYSLPSFPLLNSTSILTKIKAGYFFNEASTLEQVKKSNYPTLFIHGTDDDFVPFYMANQLYEACNSEKALFSVPNAGHGAAFDTDPVAYANAVSKFIENYVK